MAQYRMRGLDGREYGPVDLDKFKMWIREGRVVPEMMVERDGPGMWVRADSLPELGEAFRMAAAPAPPPQPTGADPHANYGPGGVMASRALVGPPVVNRNANLSVSNCYGRAWGLLDLTFILQVFVGGLVAGALPLILAGPMAVGIYRCAIKKVDGVPCEFSEVFSGFDQFADALIGYILWSLAALSFCIPPVGIYVMAKLYYWNMIIAARPGRGGFESLQDSWSITDGRFWDCAGLAIVAFGAILAGFLCLCVGIFVAMPLVVLAGAVAFRELVPRETASSPAGVTA